MELNLEKETKVKKGSRIGNFKFLLKYIGKYKKYALITPVFILLESLIEVLIPAIMSKLMDKGIGYETSAGFVQGEIKYALIYGAIIIVLAGLSTLLGYFGAKTAVIASQGFAKNIREAEFDAIQDFSFSNADKFQTSSLITRLTTDVTNTATSFQMVIRLMMRAPAMIIIATAMSFVFSSSIAVIYLIAIPVLLIGLIGIMVVAFPIFKKMLGKIDTMNRDIQENLIGIRVVKSFVREDFETKKFKNSSKEVMGYAQKAERAIILNGPLMNFVIYFVTLFIAFTGGVHVVLEDSGLTYSQLTPLIQYAVMILFGLMMVSMFLVQFVMASASMARIREVLDEKPEIVDNTDLEDQPVKDGSIEFKNVCFSYSKSPDSYVLNNINLSIKSGETIGIIGGTGSSKSTIVNLIPRLYDVTEGELLVGGVNVKDYRLHTLRDSVSVVLQKNVLFSGTISENLRWGNADATDEEIVEACKKACADDFIQSFPDKYNTELGQGGCNVSGGQKQRLCIARALLKKPKIIILDDSTSAVDTATDASIQAEFKKNLSDVTTIIIAQRISSIKEADKIIVLDNGVINGFGTHNELLKTNEIYQEVYNSQTKGAE